MSDSLPEYETQGPTWSERAPAGELRAVINPGGTERQNEFAHAVGLVGARVALKWLRRQGVKAGKVVDFGCGTGRFVRFFGSHGHAVLGVDITPEMLSEARRFGLPPHCEVQPTDGVHIPAADASVDLVWVCGVLKYSLFVNPFTEFIPQPDPSYPRIAREVFRVLKPGGAVVNIEMYVNVPPKPFVDGFEQAGFVTDQVRVLHRWTGRLEQRCQSRLLPRWLVRLGGSLCARYRYRFDDPQETDPAMRDYLFIWSKPRS